VTNLRVLAAVRAGGAPTTDSSLLKICGSELRQRISDLLRQASGAYALPSDATLPAAAQYFNLRKLSIFAGSNEIQKNIIAKSLLSL
jgi:alkylation response protein AidB-like acyl-CoA dehydrogenase